MNFGKYFLQSIGENVYLRFARIWVKGEERDLMVRSMLGSKETSVI